MSVALSNAKRWQKTDLSPIACSASGVQSVASFPLNMATRKQAMNIFFKMAAIAVYAECTCVAPSISCCTQGQKQQPTPYMESMEDDAAAVASECMVVATRTS